MRNLLLSTLALSVLLVQSAFAKDLGVLSEDQIPQDLIQADVFLNPQDTNNVAARHQNYLGYYGSNWGWGYGYYPSYYGSYYYPYYDYSLYGLYGLGWGSWYYLNEGSSNRPNTTVNPSSPVTRDAAHVPVVCFASNSLGNWFANADIASNVVRTQQNANNECSSAGGTCTLNLGCALAMGGTADSE